MTKILYKNLKGENLLLTYQDNVLINKIYYSKNDNVPPLAVHKVTLSNKEFNYIKKSLQV